MATEENKDRPSLDPEEPQGTAEEGEVAEEVGDPESPAGGTSDEDPAAVAGSPGNEDGEDESWPRSWIVATTVLGIAAIIIVARMVGNNWREQEAPEGGNHSRKAPSIEEIERREDEAHERGAPPTKAVPNKQSEKGPKPLPGFKVLLDFKDFALPAGKTTCVGRDGKAHPASPGKPPPEICHVSVEGSRFRLELQRAREERLPLWVVSTGADTPTLFHALLPRRKDNVPIWIASNLAIRGKLAIILRTPNKPGSRLTRVRLVVKQDPT